MHSPIDDHDDPLLRVDVTSDNGRLEVHLSGELDLESGSTLAARLTEGGADRPVDLDLSGVTFVDSSGIRTLLQLTQHGRDVTLCRPSDRVRRTFELANLDHLLDAPGC